MSTITAQAANSSDLKKKPQYPKATPSIWYLTYVAIYCRGRCLARTGSNGIG